MRYANDPSHSDQLWRAYKGVKMSFESILNVMFYLLWLSMIMVGSAGLNHLLKFSYLEKKHPGCARNNATLTGISLAILMWMPFCGPSDSEQTRLLLLGLCSGFCFCYALLIVNLAMQFGSKLPENND